MSPESMYIVVAEDSAPNRRILVHLLKKCGFTVVECEDGKMAWEAIEGLEEGPHAVISDIMMPNMDGIELLRKVRNSDKWADIPFVFVSAVSDKEHIQEAKELKVNGYILKPITFARVTQKLEQLFPGIRLPKLAG